MRNNPDLKEIHPSTVDNFENVLQNALSEASSIGKNIRSIHIVKEMEYLIENNLITSHGVNTKVFLELEADPAIRRSGDPPIALLTIS